MSGKLSAVVPAVMAVAFLAISCAPPPSPTGRSVAPTSLPAGQTHVQVSLEPLGILPNSGLQLPSISPDGQWVAYLQVAAGQAVYSDALASGAGLENVSLFIRPTKRNARSVPVCLSGAAWPAWFGDGRRLAFVRRDGKRPQVGIHDLATGQTRYISTNLKSVMMLSVSPSGGRIALAGLGGAAGDAWRIWLLDVEKSQLELVAPETPSAAWQLWPQWETEDSLMYLSFGQGKARFVRRSGGNMTPSRTWDANAPADPADAFQVLAGIVRQFSPDGRRLAWFDMLSDSVVLTDLSDRPSRRLGDGTRAGCWMGNDSFVAAGEKELRLFGLDGHPPVRLMRGSWLPLWASMASHEVLACMRGKDLLSFELVRLRVQVQ